MNKKERAELITYIEQVIVKAEKQLKVHDKKMAAHKIDTYQYRRAMSQGWYQLGIQHGADRALFAIQQTHRDK